MQPEHLPETITSIFARRSCRRFSSDPVLSDHLELLCEALRWAPSGGNMQPWHFYLIKNSSIKEQLVLAAGGQKFLAEAPVVFVVCAVQEQSARRYGQRGKELYSLQDTAAAIENLLLAAQSLGYGTCWVGAFNEESVAGILKLPADQRPVAMVPVGTPRKSPATPPRKNMNEILTIME